MPDVRIMSVALLDDESAGDANRIEAGLEALGIATLDQRIAERVSITIVGGFLLTPPFGR
jgi:hypothetical protein